ncbi:acyl-CoA dehydrogenase family protein [Natrinema caseinilyticum]|uniref:acyl-CoA dehydrogenase family protein n=1 Tax=Natrinema caseinilyticum TaxID=2961570 RepID=UPI0020C244C3|nr:acyl-CoA dehydrogenase family protein [Natrinema caseinilyticum]
MELTMHDTIGLEPRHHDFRERVRSFSETEIEPAIEKYEERGEFPTELIDVLGDAGLYGINVPEEFGGEGLDTRSFVIAVEEISRVYKLPAGVLSLSCGLIGHTLQNVGTERQKEWLRDIFTENQITAVSLTEPQAGSDANALETTAERDGDEYILNGHKVWTTHGEIADLILVVARTDDTGNHNDVSMFAIPDPQEYDGLKFIRNIPCMEGDAAVESEVIYDDVRLPAEFLVGEEGKGFQYIMQALDIGRIGVAAQAVGITQGCLDASTEYADEREQFGQPIRDFQGVSFKLADMKMNLEASRLLTYQTAARLDGGADSVTQEASMAKTFATDVAMDAATEAVQIHGSRGYSTDYPVERYMREAKGTQIYEGTNEVNRTVIARDLYE